VADGSGLDLLVELGQDVTVEENDSAMEIAATGPLKGILAFSIHCRPRFWTNAWLWMV
jgi:hypothetical protein